MSDSSTPRMDSVFESFSYFPHPGTDPSNGLIGATWDIADGARVALELIERDEMSVENGELPYLNLAQRSRLMRMTIVSLGMLADRAERFVYLGNSQALQQKDSKALSQKD